MQFSPIILFVYKRLRHTKQTVESLKKNSLAGESKLYIYSDGPKDVNDEKPVYDVRNYIKSIKGFAEIIINERNKNIGLADSVISGVSEIIQRYSRAIVLEDDIVSSPNFLEFMNDALNYYENASQIFSISGYNFPLKIPQNYKNQVYLLPRASTWGWGTWSDRWMKADWQVKDFKLFYRNKNLQKTFNQGGEDLTPMLKAQMLGRIDSWGIRWSYAHYKNNGFCLYPVSSKLLNIGADKTGVHTNKTNKFDVKIDLAGTKTELTLNLEEEPVLLKDLQKFMAPSIYRKIINYLKYDLLYRCILLVQ